VAKRHSPEREPSTYRKALEEAGPYLGLGLQIGATMAFFVGMGYLVDTWLGSEPWFVLVGAVLGMTALVVQLVQISNRLDEKSRKRHTDSRSRESNIDEE
jgi:F0F1-type ATP synthase assembly protein I